MHTEHYGPVNGSRLSGSLHDMQFEKLLKIFKPDIKKYASGFAGQEHSAWVEDFYQEGSLALHDAQQKFILLPKVMDFRPYALRAIRNRMINFLEKTFSRAPKTEDLVVKYNQSEIDDEFYRTPSINEGPEYHTSITHEIDYEIVFNESNLKNNSFTDKEIKIFSLYNNHGFTVTDIAKAMEVSMGQASKMLSSTLAKSNELWNKYHSN